jgi:two-component system osmolarity sensor histidine kinase EnvZ
MMRARPSIKQFLPSSLFGRALLILLVPIVLLQALMAHIFYDRHWDSVVRNMSNAAAADVVVLVREFRQMRAERGTDEALRRIDAIGGILGIDVAFVAPEGPVVNGQGRERFPEFLGSLDNNLHEPVMAQIASEDRIRVLVDLEGSTMELMLPRKRLASSTTYIFILWMLGSSLLLVTVSGLFLRNQIRPIVQLARASEQFGLGQDVQNFSPRGASEIRRAGRAFLTMADRIRRQVQSRTEMLAGISHDLRTPLTRMKLEIEMGKLDTATREALNGDIDEMRRMIDEYLDFARGDGAEPVEPMDMAELLVNLCQQYERQGADVRCAPSDRAMLMLRPQAMRRALSNLIENALRYGGGTARVTLEQSVAYVRIKVRDAGPGIPPSEHETVFKPFTRLEPSRNSATGGVGLGLSIARDIAQSHGGDIMLENITGPDGSIAGLEVTLRLPREVQPQ